MRLLLVLIEMWPVWAILAVLLFFSSRSKKDEKALKEEAKKMKTEKVSIAQIVEHLNEYILIRIEKKSTNLDTKHLETIHAIAIDYEELRTLMASQEENLDKTVYYQQMAILKSIALDYLPENIENYLSLPVNFTHSNVDSDGKTPSQTLQESLDLILHSLDEIKNGFLNQKVESLQVQHKFLSNKL
jgi:hypothetical protein